MSSVNPSLRFAIFQRDGFACHYCGGRAPDVRLEIDHVVPRSKGGGNQSSNLVTSCQVCNQSKSSRMLPAPVLVKVRAKATPVGRITADDASPHVMAVIRHLRDVFPDACERTSCQLIVAAAARGAWARVEETLMHCASWSQWVERMVWL